ncbi:hypothetical protein TWF730_002043 [Orbilia blumenaviensis]|uniref:Uncharacterized protein n=1 Tax=Orbilia blumenaviensis TaxID=1796055 RepID=A0AAV9UFX7_9PEZI
MPTTKQTIESSPQYLTLSSFTNFISNGPTTCSELTSAINPATPTDTISTYLETLWNALLLLASQTEWSSLTHQKLVNLLQSIQSEPSTETDELPEYNGTKFSWSKLPDLSIYIRDWYNFSPPFSTSSSSQSPLNGLNFGTDEWLNLNAFLATLTKSSLAEKTSDVESTPTDYSLYAIWALRTLEVDPGTLDQVDLADVQTAAVWIVIARKELHILCKQERKYEGNLARAGDAFRDREWKGFNMDRWAVWETAFERLLSLESEKEDGEIRVIRLVRQAGIVMRMAGNE